MESDIKISVDVLSADELEEGTIFTDAGPVEVKIVVAKDGQQHDQAEVEGTPSRVLSWLLAGYVRDLDAALEIIRTSKIA